MAMAGAVKFSMYRPNAARRLDEERSARDGVRPEWDGVPRYAGWAEALQEADAGRAVEPL
jgi:hypothetical protein